MLYWLAFFKEVSPGGKVFLHISHILEGGPVLFFFFFFKHRQALSVFKKEEKKEEKR